MILLANILRGAAQFLDVALSIIILLVIARAVLSWVNADPYNQFVRYIVMITEYVLRPVRRFVPLVGPGIDLSPIILFILISIIKVVVVQSLADYGEAMRISAMRY